MMWRQKQTPSCLKRKREDGDEKLNSSFQVPNHARITNSRVKTGRKAHLLTLPTHIRQYVFRLAIVNHQPLVVSANNVAASTEPGLLQVSHDIRVDAIKIFYMENSFDLHVHGFDAAALLPWMDKADRHRQWAAESGQEVDVKMEDGAPVSKTAASDAFLPGLEKLSPSQAVMAKKQRAYIPTAISRSQATTDSIAWTIPFQPDWRNLIMWLELFHAGKLPGPPNDGEGSSQERAAFAIFDVVEALRGEEWAMVEKVLPGLREMLGAWEAWWLADEEAAGGEGDGRVEKEEMVKE